MDIFQLQTLISGILALLVGALLYQLKRTHGPNTKIFTAPQAGGAWPIVGHLHLFGAHQLTHKTLGTMADKHGPIFTIKLGSYKVLVLSSWEMAKECFTVHDKAFSTRPCVAASKLMTYNSAMFGFAPYGSYWREMRKFATIELLSNQRLEQLKDTRTSELDAATRKVYKLWSREGCPKGGVLVDMKQWFGDLTHNIVLRMVGGKPYYGASDDYAEERAVSRNGKEEQDVMDVMLNVLPDLKVSGYDSDTIIKATCLNLILAGGDSIMVALTWALSLLLNNEMELKKAQDELDTHVGKDRNVEESDIKKLVYLEAIVKETMRLYPPSPIITLRAAMEECTFSCGYHIPAGTHLIVNTWKVQRDGSVWSEPHDFKPERFLTSHKEVDVKGQNYELVPFGSGRRVCPGASLALRVLHLTLARLLHSFDVASPSNQLVDMTESIGLTNLKATPLEVLLTPRVLIYRLKTTDSGNNKIRSAPQAGGAWPIVGHLHLFGGHQHTHKTLGMMAEKHGPIFTIKLGSYKVLVLSSWEMAKECFTVHDKAFSTRPCVAASKLMGYNYAMFGFTPYGPYWREMRKLATIELLSNHRLELLKSTRTSELEAAIRELHKLWSRESCPKGGVLVDMKQWFGDLTHSIVLRMVRGKPYGDDYAEGEARRYKKAMRDCMSLFGVFVLSDAIPFLRWLDINGYEKAMKRAASELDPLVEGWLVEHKRKRALSMNGKEEQDFMDVMLNVLQDVQISGYDSDTTIKATCLGKNYELVPFGSGRRACPGASLALRVVHLTLARLLHSFNVASPSNQVVDMTESIGLTNLKATPIEVLLTPRLDTKLYED
ncbi:Cytochrome P450 82C4, partial [Mucuna pruriens]